MKNFEVYLPEGAGARVTNFFLTPLQKNFEKNWKFLKKCRKLFFSYKSTYYDTKYYTYLTRAVCMVRTQVNQSAVLLHQLSFNQSFCNELLDI